MNTYTTNVVTMSFEHVNFFECVIVEYPNLHIIAASDDPIFPSNELGGSNWQVANLKLLQVLLSLGVPDVDVSVVKRD